MSGDGQKNQNVDLKALSDVVRSVLALADEVTERTVALGSMYQQAALFLFTKSHKTFKAICLLCESNFIEDAGILLRSIFEILVNARYIAERPKERARLYLEYDYIMKKKAFDISDKRKWRADDIKDILSEYNRVKDNYPDKWHWAGDSMTISKMAQEVGLSKHYETHYWVLSNLAHTTPRAAVSYLRVTEQGLLVGNLEGRDQLFRVLRESCIYFLEIISINNSAFELGLEDKIDAVGRQASWLLKG